MSEAQINELFASCLPRLRKASRKMLANQQDCEDALQDGLLLAFRKLHQFEGRSSFLTWLYSIVRNTSRMHYRKASGRHALSLESESPSGDVVFSENDFVENRPSPEQVCIQQERSEILRKAAREMPAKYHPAIYLFHLEGLGEAETAHRLRITPSALKSQLHRSRRMLTSRIRKSCLTRDLRTPGFSARSGLRLRSATQGKARLPY
jgi:RNA polymerase sigma-70 factor, ECF subfamily